MNTGFIWQQPDIYSIKSNDKFICAFAQFGWNKESLFRVLASSKPPWLSLELCLYKLALCPLENPADDRFVDAECGRKIC